MNNDYSFYLFCKLRDLILPSKEAYDLLYSEDKLLFEEFLDSSFNLDSKGEYECIVDFLKSKEIRYNILDRNENLVASNLSEEQCERWLQNKPNLYLLEKI